MSEQVAAPFDGYRTVVGADWIDHNGHLNAGYYMVAFDEAVSPWMDFCGLDDDHRSSHGVTTFSAEAHLTYDREVLEGATLRVQTQLLGYDAKRIHAIHLMYVEGDGYLAATNELMSLHVDQATRRVAPMAPEVTDRLVSIWEAHRHLPRPAQAGRVLSVPGWESTSP